MTHAQVSREGTISNGASPAGGIQILSTRVLRGPNVWARVPVIHLVVDIGELEDRLDRQKQGAGVPPQRGA